MDVKAKEREREIRKSMCCVKLFHNIDILLIYLEKRHKLVDFLLLKVVVVAPTYLVGHSHEGQDL